MDGFYPYHEMNTYMGLIAMALAVVGAGGRATRDRWASFWVLLIGIGCDPDAGQVHVPFRLRALGAGTGQLARAGAVPLWVSLGVAALAAAGVERLARPGVVSLRGGLILARRLVALSIPIMIYIYSPVWTEPKRWTNRTIFDRYRWLGRELFTSVIRTALLALAAWWIARSRARSSTRSGGCGGPRCCRFWSWPTFWARTGLTCPRSIPGTGPSRRSRLSG